MKIRRLVLENFGAYGYREFQFDAAPLVLVYGANEAGKTTALNGIRQALMGFRPRTPYLTGAAMKAEVALQLRDQSELSFSRVKGRPDQVSASLDDAPITELQLKELLCNLDLDSYESLFGFSQDELRQGQATLKHSQLSEALAGGNFGGIQALESLRNELADESTQLYKARGSTPRINLKLAELERIRSDLEQHQVLPSVVVDLRRELREAQEKRGDIRNRARALINSKALLERQLEALPTFQERVSVLHELEAIPVPASVDARFIAQWGEHADARKELKQQVRELNEGISKHKSELAALCSSSYLFEFETQVETLGHHAESVTTAREELRELEQQKETLTQKLNDGLEQVGLAEYPDSLASFQISLPRRRELEQLAAEYKSCAEKLIELRAQEKMASSRNSEDSPVLLVPDEDINSLQGALDNLQKLESDLAHQLASLEKQIQKPEFVQLERELCELLPQGITLSTAWQLPSAEQAIEFGKRFADLNAARASSRAAASRLEQELERLATPQQASVSEATKQPEDLLRELEVFSLQRDKIIEHWLDELSQPLIAASISPDQQIERLQELQRIAQAANTSQEHLIDAADALAKHRQAQARRGDLEQELAGLRQLESESTAAVQELENAWIEYLSELPLQCNDVETVTHWQTQYETWRRQALEHQNTRKHLHQLRNQAKHLRSELLDSWPTPLRLSASVEMLQTQLLAWRESAQRSKLVAQQRSESRQVRASLRGQVQETETRLASLQSRFHVWLESTPVEQWPTEDAGKLVDVLLNLRQHQQSLENVERKLHANREKVQLFESGLQSLLDGLRDQQLLGDDELRTVSEAPELWCGSLLQQLHSARSQKEQTIRLRSEIEHQMQTLATVEKQLAELDENLASLCTTVDSGSVAETTSLLDQVHQAEALRTKLRQLDAALSAFCGEATLQEFCDLLKAGSATELQAQLTEVNAELVRLEHESDACQQGIGQLEERLESISQSTRSQQLQQDLQQQRGELAELAEQWIVNRLAQELLAKSIELFAEENEPQLLKLSRKYLTELTGGRYVTVEHDSSRKEPFLVRNKMSEAFPPERLSTGTREQLYLAIRMAYIAQHCESQDPLPVVMDDCFVNFDDLRTENAVRSIANWNPDIQTILLSCHSRLPKILSKVAPNTPVLDLQRDECLLACELTA